jgi:hypothetical protein
MTKPIPPKLYKYQPYNVQTLDNLKNRRLWFSKASRFNDPFDCSIPFSLGEISADDYDTLYALFRSAAPDKKKADSKYLSKGKPNDLLKKEVAEGVRKASTVVEAHQRGVACFAERLDDILMWSHYGDGHRGFCLEFDTKFDPFQKAHQVIYSDSYPVLNPADVLLRRTHDAAVQLLTRKSSHWCYEREWRVIHKEGDKEYGVDVSALTGIYFGCAMPFVHKEVIALILAKSPTRLYEMKQSSKGFAVSAELCEYIPYDYNKNKPASSDPESA